MVAVTQDRQPLAGVGHGDNACHVGGCPTDMGVMMKLILRYQMIMTDEPVMSSQFFYILQEMFIFARKDPAVLAV